MSKLTSVHQVSLLTALLVCIFVLVLSLMNVALMQQNMQIKASADQSTRSLVLQPGTEVPPLDGMDANGNRMTVRYGEDNRKTLLLVFSPTCGACRLNMPNWQAIARGLDPRAYRIVAASLAPEGSQEYLERYGLSQIPAMTELDAEDRVSYNLVLSPQLIMVDANGKTEKVWTGALNGVQKQDVENTLNIDLP